MSVLAVAALSARMLAEAASDDGFDVAALDLFGDADTRRACSQWSPIGQPGALHIDAALLLQALAALAQQRGVTGWIAGSGFEAQPELLERGAALLPLIGTPADAVRRVCDPQVFFDFLDAEKIAHPPLQMSAPADAAAWLVKDAQGSGGWHIRRAVPNETLSAQHYFQREMSGTPMSATFIANGSDACVLGFNQLIVRRFGARPFVFCGAVGPLPLTPDVAQRITAAARSIAAAFSLRGLGSLDFMLDGADFGVLEVNPRPPASIALYRRHGVVAAHVRAWRRGELPPSIQPVSSKVVQGTEIVFAPRALRLDERAARRLAEHAGCHDLPFAATRFDAWDPVCSVAASGTDAAQVRSLLDLRRDAVHSFLETLS
jgi:uncharacterized protein